ncbi:unnamed protein product [Coffea canephora]|uniref:Non-classical arabinogalactan protein 31-like n=1 Tax=Coffea canephora TaxID=49390 RepID=A0A068TU88_COFCA|nr:unnamed protein product [Coffea canephora]
MLLLISSSVFADQHEHSKWPAHPPAEAPEHHKGHHHHHHHHHPPTYPPVKPPVHPPVKPPVHPPVKPPVHPPVYPPVKPPVHPPVKPPVHPPVKPPVHPPVKPPVHPPVKPPVKPPVYPPVKPPVHPPVRKLVAVQGVVYCKTCSYAGFNPKAAVPLQGAVVRVRCHNTRFKPVVAEGRTDKNGYFLIVPEMVTSVAASTCKAYLVKSPSMKCSAPTNLNYGSTGAGLMPNPAHKPNPLAPKYALYNVGPFAFGPAKLTPCHR